VTGRWPIRLALVATGLLLIVAAGVFWVRLQLALRLDLLGIDLRIIHVFTDRWISSGSMYLPSQLAGPYGARDFTYDLATLPSLYPPNTIVLFLLIRYLPDIIWWLVPLGVLIVAFRTWRPSWWTWPLLAAVAALPTTTTSFLVGNTAMWAVAGVAGGLLWGWPAALVALKPSLVPFALLGILGPRDRFAIGILAILVTAALTATQWGIYLAAVRNSDAGPLYSIRDWPMMLAPAVAWMGRRNRTA
jgi:hypothetical protein